MKDRFLQRWLTTTLAVFVAAHVVPGIEFEGYGALLVTSLLLGMLNVFVKPVLLLLSLPLVLFTFGFAILFLNGLLLYLAGALVKSFTVASFGAAFWGALVISIVSLVVNLLFGTSHPRVQVQTGKPRDPKDGQGPIIDV